MAITMANDEHIVKTWAYGRVKSGHQKTSAEILFTNKRIISVSESKSARDIDEVPLDTVNTISFHKSGCSPLAKVLSILEIIVGVPFSVLIFGIFMIMDGVRRIKSGEFSLDITTKGMPDPAISIGLQRGKLQKKAGKIKVWIDKNVVDEIGNEIGALYLSNR